MIRVPLTPADVANKQFKISFRGYSLDEVDGFLDEIEAELGRLMRDNAALREAPPARPAAVAPPVFQAPAPAPAPVREPELGEGGQQAALRTLLLAQRTADDAIAEARADAARIVAEAQARAAGTDAEISRRISEALGGVEERKRKLEREIEELRVFEREYRVRLKAYLESQLSDIMGRGAPDDGGAGVPAAARTAAITGGSATAGQPGGPPPQPNRDAGSAPEPGQSPSAQPPSVQPPSAQLPSVQPPSVQPPPVRPSAPAPTGAQGPPAASSGGAPPTSVAPGPVPAPASRPAAGVPSYAPVPPSDAAPSLSLRPATPGQGQPGQGQPGQGQPGQGQPGQGQPGQGQPGQGQPPVGPPREAGLRAVPPLEPDKAPEPIGPFTIVPPSVFAEQLDEGPEPPATT